MATDNTSDTTDGQLTDPVSGIPLGSLGAAECRLAFDEDTYQRVRDEYERAVEHGYSDGFDTFAFNHCTTEWAVVVDGKPVAEPHAEDGDE
jgi:hypothetical protein